MRLGLRLISILLTAFLFAVPALRSSAAELPSGEPVRAHALTHDDVEAYFDGFFPDALARANIAGAVVVVVKDGKVLLEKGYGYSDWAARKPVDPKSTLFRPGSISKLFTWTAVMQLVEAGKLDLDRDVNVYLDFEIPPAFGRPITLRNLMTHTPGFEEHIKGLMVSDPARRLSLRGALIGGMPSRIYPPGEVSAYSNYGASLAGYIVQRVSGERFEDYIDHHIFKPLGMTHSTFEQPLPKRLAADMSKGYRAVGKPPEPFEIISWSPAGALSASGDDIARFMIAHLNDGEYNGVQIVRPQTAERMHGEVFRPVAALPGMGLGFYHEDRNGQTIVGHGGDTQFFHSDLHLILKERVGLYVSLNSAGTDLNPVIGVRPALLNGFMNRYFPVALPPAKAIASAKEDAQKVAGSYEVSRRSETNFMNAARLIQQFDVVADKDGSLSIPFLVQAHGPKRWIEIAPFVWRDEHGPYRLAARLDRNGRVLWLVDDMVPPILVLQPVSFWRLAHWNIPLFIGASVVLALTALLWPLKALLRWRYDRPFGLAGAAATLYRLTRIVALTDVIMVAGWSTFLLMGQANLAVFDAPSDHVVRALQVLAALALAGSIVPALSFLYSVADPERPWWTKVTDAFVALAALAIAWFVISLKLVTLSLNY